MFRFYLGETETCFARGDDERRVVSRPFWPDKIGVWSDVVAREIDWRHVFFARALLDVVSGTWFRNQRVLAVNRQHVFGVAPQVR